MATEVDSTVYVTLNAMVEPMAFNHVVENSSGCWNSSYPTRLTCSSAGSWRFRGDIWFTPQCAMAQLVVRIGKNGGTALASQSYSSGQLPVGTPVRFNMTSASQTFVSGDYTEVQFLFFNPGESVVAGPYEDPMDLYIWNPNFRAWKV